MRRHIIQLASDRIRWSHVPPTFAACILLVSATLPAAAQPAARSAILFIGDGMGPAQVTAGRLYKGGASGGQLHLDTFEHVGIVKTWAANGAVTDSASSGTAMAAGEKTNNGRISMAPDGERSTPTILELAKAAGKSVGVISTATITHATPACFYAHVPSRNDEAAIALQLVTEADIDLAMGGGRRFFVPLETLDGETQQPGARRDGRDLIEEAAAKGFRVVQSRDDFDALAAQIRELGPSAPAPLILGLFDASHMAYDYQRGEDAWGEPSLAEMTALAIDVLSRNPNGYFLMVEGGRIDHACHSNNALLAVTDMVAFDDAVRVGDEAARADGRTLVVVTADHETGGLAINGYFPPGVSGLELFTRPLNRQGGDLLSFATGPGAGRPEGPGVDYSSPAYRQAALVFMLSAAHTGVDVHVWASGAGAEIFGGTMENTEIARRTAAALGLSFPRPPSFR